MKRFFAVFLLVLLALPSSGGVIRAVINPVDVFTNRTGEITVYTTLVNLGDEAAENVRVSLIIPDGFESNVVSVGTLDVEKPENISFRIKVPEGIKQGVYPAVTLIDYTDLNNYPFSSVTPGTIKYGIEEYPLMYADLEQAALRGGEKTTARLTIRNLDEVERNVSVTLFLPREIKSENMKKSVVVDAKNEAHVEFNVSSLGALPQSSYLVFAAVEYEDSVHYMLPIRPSIFSITEGGEPAGVDDVKLRKTVSSTEKAKLGESGLVKKLPYALILLSAAVLYFSFKGK